MIVYSLHKTGNYASSFVVWDWVFGTDTAYRKRCVFYIFTFFPLTSSKAKQHASNTGVPKSVWDYLIYDQIFALPTEKQG